MDLFLIRTGLGCLLFLILCLSILNMGFIKEKIRFIFSDFNSMFLAWILLFIGIQLLAERKTIGVYVDKFVIFQVSMFLLAGVIVFINFAARMTSAISNLNPPLICLMLYGVVGIISGFYSPQWVLSLYKSIVILIDVFVCILLLSYRPTYIYVKKFIYLTYLFYILLLLSFIIGALLKPDIGLRPFPGTIGHILNGVLPINNPNAVGFIAAILCLVFANRALDAKKIKEKLFYGIFFLSSVVVLLLSQARTSIVAFSIALLFLLTFKKKIVYIFIIIFLCLPFAMTGAMKDYAQYSVDYFKRGQDEKQFRSMSGRLLAWKEGWQKVQESPILGYGMASVRFGKVLDKVSTGHMHNAFLEVLINTGFLGFFFWFYTLVAVSINIFRNTIFVPKWLDERDRSLLIEISAILLCSLIRMITGEVFTVHNSTFFLYICLIAYSSVIIRADFSSKTMTLNNKQRLI